MCVSLTFDREEAMVGGGGGGKALINCRIANSTISRSSTIMSGRHESGAKSNNDRRNENKEEGGDGGGSGALFLVLGYICLFEGKSLVVVLLLL
jgi:hypothetical protein